MKNRHHFGYLFAHKLSPQEEKHIQITQRLRIRDGSETEPADQEWLHHFWGPVRNEHVGLLVKKLKTQGSNIRVLNHVWGLPSACPLHLHRSQAHEVP